MKPWSEEPTNLVDKVWATPEKPYDPLLLEVKKFDCAKELEKRVNYLEGLLREFTEVPRNVDIATVPKGGADPSNPAHRKQVVLNLSVAWDRIIRAEEYIKATEHRTLTKDDVIGYILNKPKKLVLEALELYQIPYRIVCENNKNFMLTADLNLDRLNLTIENDTVTKASYG